MSPHEETLLVPNEVEPNDSQVKVLSTGEFLVQANRDLDLCYRKLRHLKSSGCTRKNSSDFLFFLHRRSSIEATIFSLHEALRTLNSPPESAKQ